MSNFFVKLIKNPFVINLLLVIVVSCGVVYGVLAWLDSYTRHNQAVVVPDVKGMKLEDAAEFFGNNKLRYNVIDSVFSKDVAPGSIVELVPGVGSKVKEGRIVFVTINALTSQMAVIPEVEDLSFRQAYALLRARGFSSVEIEYVPGDYKDLAMGGGVKRAYLAQRGTCTADRSSGIESKQWRSEYASRLIGFG